MTPTTALAGELLLRIGVRGTRSVAVEQFHTGALRVLRPHYLDRSGQVCYTAINPGGGYLGGDRYRFQLDVDAGASVLFTSQAATKVYRTPTEPARQHTEIRLGPDAVLESLPDQLIVYREGSYEQTTRAEVDPTATYIATEVVTPGWAPEGTRFGYRRAVLRTEIRRPTSPDPVLVDALVLDPAASGLTGLGGLDGRTHLGSLLVVDRRVDADLLDAVQDCCDAATGLLAGVSLGPGPALVLRVLGDDTPSVARLLFRVDALLRRRWFNQDHVDLRKC